MNRSSFRGHDVKGLFSATGKEFSGKSRGSHVRTLQHGKSSHNNMTGKTATSRHNGRLKEHPSGSKHGNLTTTPEKHTKFVLAPAHNSSLNGNLDKGPGMSLCASNKIISKESPSQIEEELKAYILPDDLYNHQGGYNQPSKIQGAKENLAVGSAVNEVNPSKINPSSIPQMITRWGVKKFSLADDNMTNSGGFDVPHENHNVPHNRMSYAHHRQQRNTVGHCPSPGHFHNTPQATSSTNIKPAVGPLEPSAAQNHAQSQNFVKYQYNHVNLDLALPPQNNVPNLHPPAVPWNHGGHQRELSCSDRINNQQEGPSRYTSIGFNTNTSFEGRRNGSSLSIMRKQSDRGDLGRGTPGNRKEDAPPRHAQSAQGFALINDFTANQMVNPLDENLRSCGKNLLDLHQLLNNKIQNALQSNEQPLKENVLYVIKNYKIFLENTMKIMDSLDH